MMSMMGNGYCYLFGDEHLFIIGVTTVHELLGLFEHPQIRVHVHRVGNLTRLFVVSGSLGEFACE